MRIPLSSLGEPFYEGSVQRLYAVPGDETLMVTETSDRGSVFDVGALFSIEGQDVNRALFRHVLYSRLGRPELWREVREAIAADTSLEDGWRAELLAGPLEEACERGLRTHHEGMLDARSGEVCRDGVPENPSAFNVVRRYRILKPPRVRSFHHSLFDYSSFAHEDGYVVPLEYIVRFGMTSASSLFRKYENLDAAGKSALEAELGLGRPLRAWEMLERPVSDFTSKFEPEDRMVSVQEAMNMSGLSAGAFVRSSQLGVLGAWAVRLLVEGLGLRLWDIKWEFAKDGDALVYVDTIDTDSFRATLELEDGGRRIACHCNKQAMRDYFTLLHGDWIQSIREAKELGRREGVAFTGILQEGQAQGRYAPTPEVDPAFLGIQVEKMAAIRDHLLERIEAPAARARLQGAGLAELDFYRSRGRLEALAKINGID